MKLPYSAILLAFVVSSVNAQARLVPFQDSLPRQRVAWEMVPVPAGRVMLPGSAGAVSVPAFWIGRTEVPWELYDVFYLRFDVPRAERARVDAASRPSKPYGAPDLGFGHRGYPAISLTHRAALDFAAWLSTATGHHYRVASDAQWQRAADLALAGGTVADSIAWSAANAGSSTHPVGTRAADRLGLLDLFGNVGEWVTAADGSAWLRGGSFQTPADSVSSTIRQRQQPSWNKTDPQIPKSRWWLSDGPFAGFRLVRIP